MGKTLIFHGSNIDIKAPQIIISEKTKDFGYGFYCTVIKEQAERWARRFSTPIVNSYSFLPNINLNILEFKTMTDEWLDFIVSCRLGKPHNYDIVIGAIANDQIYNYVSDYIDGVISKDQFWYMAKFKYPTHQICFCNEESLKSIKYESSYQVVTND